MRKSKGTYVQFKSQFEGPTVDRYLPKLKGSELQNNKILIINFESMTNHLMTIQNSTDLHLMNDELTYTTHVILVTVT